jgi:hypothetical protein
MRRVIAIAAALGAVLAAGAGPASGTACPDKVGWHATSYKGVVTHAHIPLGRRLGKGTIASSCRTTHTTTPGGGYAVRPAREPDVVVKRVVYAVDGLRPQVAVAIAGPKPTLYVSSTPATSGELRVLRRLRGR